MSEISDSGRSMESAAVDFIGIIRAACTRSRSARGYCRLLVDARGAIAQPREPKQRHVEPNAEG